MQEEPLIVGDPWSHQKGSTKLKLRSKLAYGIGGIPFNITGTVLAFFLSVFLLEVAKVGTMTHSCLRVCPEFVTWIFDTRDYSTDIKVAQYYFLS